MKDIIIISVIYLMKPLPTLSSMVMTTPRSVSRSATFFSTSAKSTPGGIVASQAMLKMGSL